MIVKKIKGIDQDVYMETLENGLRVYLVPFKNRKNYYINYVTNFGSVINKFIPVGKKDLVTVPYGVAHFLEHKMFEQENGEDPFEFFSKSGSDANASTGYKSTSYTLEGTINIEENLEYLLNYVNSPYFTDENVEKEKNIIVEEINMYNDEPEGKLYEASGKSIFKFHPMRIDIGGTEKSVRSITKENLYDCYNSFYQPSNMFLVIGGNFDVDKVLFTIKNNKKLLSNKIRKNVVIKRVKEPLEVNEKFKELKINNIVIPKFIFTIKLSLKDISIDRRYEYGVYVSLLLGILYGSSSPFRERMLKEEKMSILATSKAIIDDFLLIEFVAESKCPKELATEIVKHFNEYEITEEEIERHKKVLISYEVLKSDKVVSTVNMLSGCIVDYNDIIFEEFDVIRSVNFTKMLEVKNSINIDNSSLVIAYPKE